MNTALHQSLLFGLSSNIPFLQFLLQHKDFISQQLNINSLEKIHQEEYSPPILPFPEDFLKQLYQELSNQPQNIEKEKTFNPWSDFSK